MLKYEMILSKELVKQATCENWMKCRQQGKTKTDKGDFVDCRRLGQKALLYEEKVGSYCCFPGTVRKVKSGKCWLMLCYSLDGSGRVEVPGGSC